MSTETFPPVKISDEAFYWLMRYETKAGRTVESKNIAELLGIKTGAASMQISRARKRLEAGGVDLALLKEEGGGEANGKGKSGVAKKREVEESDEGLDGMLNPKKKAKGKKVKGEDAEE